MDDNTIPNSSILYQYFNSFTPKFKTYILPVFWRQMYKWGSENW